MPELESLSTDHLFHRLWTKAVGTTGYVKAEWMELDRRLQSERMRKLCEAVDAYYLVHDLESEPGKEMKRAKLRALLAARGACRAGR